MPFRELRVSLVTEVALAVRTLLTAVTMVMGMFPIGLTFAVGACRTGITIMMGMFPIGVAFAMRACLVGVTRVNIRTRFIGGRGNRSRSARIIGITTT